MLSQRSYREPSEADLEIAKLVVKEIPDGAVLPQGWGACPLLLSLIHIYQILRRLWPLLLF